MTTLHETIKKSLQVVILTGKLIESDNGKNYGLLEENIRDRTL